MTLWLFLHLLGMGVWMGGGLSAMVMAMASRGEPRAALGTVARMQWAISRNLVFPGALLTVISGLFLTMRLMGTAAMGSGSLVAMQGLGMVAALMALALLVPTSAKLARLDPAGEHAAFFDRLRARQRIAGGIAGILVVLSLLAAAIYRYGG